MQKTFVSLGPHITSHHCYAQTQLIHRNFEGIILEDIYGALSDPQTLVQNHKLLILNFTAFFNRNILIPLCVGEVTVYTG